MQQRTKTTRGQFLFGCLLLVMPLFVRCSSSSSSSSAAAAFLIPNNKYSSIQQHLRHRHQQWQEGPDSSVSATITRTKTCMNNPLKLRGSNNDGDQEFDFQRYNDDAFGLIFLIGGFASQDFDFAGTFLITSAAAAIATSRNLLPQDPRVPGLVAIVSVLLSPVVSSLRSGTSIGDMGTPLPIEVGLCCFSLIVGIYKWKKGEEI